MRQWNAMIRAGVEGKALGRIERDIQAMCRYQGDAYAFLVIVDHTTQITAEEEAEP